MVGIAISAALPSVDIVFIFKTRRISVYLTPNLQRGWPNSHPFLILYKVLSLRVRGS
jgi:hypothetical protein